MEFFSNFNESLALYYACILIGGGIFLIIAPMYFNYFSNFFKFIMIFFFTIIMMCVLNFFNYIQIYFFNVEIIFELIMQQYFKIYDPTYVFSNINKTIYIIDNIKESKTNIYTYVIEKYINLN